MTQQPLVEIYTQPARKSDIIFDYMDVQVLKHLILTAYKKTKNHALCPSNTNAAPHRMHLYYYNGESNNIKQKGVYLCVTTTPCSVPGDLQARTAHTLIEAVQITHVAEPHPGEKFITQKPTMDRVGLCLFKAEKLKAALNAAYNTIIDTPNPVTAVKKIGNHPRLYQNIIKKLVKARLDKLDDEIKQIKNKIKTIAKANHKSLLPALKLDFGRWVHTTSAFKSMQPDPKTGKKFQITNKNVFLLQKQMIVPKGNGICYFFVLQTQQREMLMKGWAPGVIKPNIIAQHGGCSLCDETLAGDDDDDQDDTKSTAEMKIFTLLSNSSDSMENKNMVATTYPIRVDECYTTRRVRGSPVSEPYHEISLLPTFLPIGSNEAFPERPYIGGFSQENTIGWPGVEYVNFHILLHSEMTTDKLVDMVSCSFDRFIAKSLRMELVTANIESQQYQTGDNVVVNRNNEKFELMETIDESSTALKPTHLTVMTPLIHEDKDFTKNLHKHSMWTTTRYRLDGLAAKYLAVTGRSESLVYAHPVVEACLAQRAEALANARFQTRLLRAELAKMENMRACAAALNHTTVTWITYNGDAHVGSARTAGSPGGSPQGKAWETRHEIHAALWHAQSGLDDGVWEERPLSERDILATPQLGEFGELYATRTRIFRASPHGFHRVYVEGVLRRPPSHGRCGTIERYRVVPYAVRQFLFSLATSSGMTDDNKNSQYFVNLPRGVVSANIALIRNCPQRVARVEVRRWGIRRAAKVAQLLAVESKNIDQSNLCNKYDDKKNYWGNDSTKSLGLTQPSGLRYTMGRTAMPGRIVRPCEPKFLPVPNNSAGMYPAEVYAPNPQSELVVYLQNHLGWIEF